MLYNADLFAIYAMLYFAQGRGHTDCYTAGGRVYYCAMLGVIYCVVLEVNFCAVLVPGL